MSERFQLPVMLDGRAVHALVVGGGSVGARKARWLLDGGARVTVRALAITAELRAVAERDDRLTIREGAYDPDEAAAATLVVAATSDRDLNARIAADARAARALVVVVDAADEGTCIAPAVHRAGTLLVAVSAGGVPRAAARIRDALARRFDARYAAAVRELASLRRDLLGAARRDRWHAASDALVGEDFCETVESESFDDRVASWR